MNKEIEKVETPISAGGCKDMEEKLKYNLFNFLDNTVFAKSEWKGFYNKGPIIDIKIEYLDSDYNYVFSEINTYIREELIETLTKNPGRAFKRFSVPKIDATLCESDATQRDTEIEYTFWVARLKRIQGKILTLIESYIEDAERRKAIKDIIKDMFNNTLCDSSKALIDNGSATWDDSVTGTLNTGGHYAT